MKNKVPKLSLMRITQIILRQAGRHTNANADRNTEWNKMN